MLPDGQISEKIMEKILKSDTLRSPLSAFFLLSSEKFLPLPLKKEFSTHISVQRDFQIRPRPLGIFRGSFLGLITMELERENCQAFRNGIPLDLGSILK